MWFCHPPIVNSLSLSLSRFTLLAQLGERCAVWAGTCAKASLGRGERLVARELISSRTEFQFVTASLWVSRPFFRWCDIWILRAGGLGCCLSASDEHGSPRCMPLHTILPSHPQLWFSSLIRRKQLYIHALGRGCQFPQTSLSVLFKSRRWVQVSNSVSVMSENGVKCNHCSFVSKCMQFLFGIQPKSTNSIPQDHRHRQEASPHMSGHQISKREIPLRRFQSMCYLQLFASTYAHRRGHRPTGALYSIKLLSVHSLQYQKEMQKIMKISQRMKLLFFTSVYAFVTLSQFWTGVEIHDKRPKIVSCGSIRKTNARRMCRYGLGNISEVGRR